MSAVRACLAPIVLLLIVVGVFWRITLTDQYSWIESFDIANQVVPWFNFEAQQFHLHRFPIWDPFLFGGQSLIGQGQPGLAYPLNWIFFSLPLRDGHLNITYLNWYFVLIHYLAALFCYLLCRDLGRSRIASVLAGVAFGISGYVGNTSWPQMISGAIWGPLVLLFVFRAARGVRPIASAALGGLFLGMSWLAGHHQIPIFLTLASVAIWLCVLFGRGRRKLAQFAPAAVFFAFFVCAGALQIWPAYEYGQIAVRWSGSQHDPLAWNEPVPHSVHENYAFSAIQMLGFVIPGYAESFSPYAGVAGLALAGLALACWWKTREVRIMFGIGVAGLLYSLAKNDVFQGILYAVVPLVEKARSPSAAIYLTQFAISVLVAFGLDSLFMAENRAMVRRLAVVLAVSGAVLLLITFSVYLGHGFTWSFDDRVVLCPLVALGLAGLIYRCSQASAAVMLLPALIIGVYVLEQGNVAAYGMPPNDDKELAVYRTAFDTTRNVARVLKQQPDLARVDVSREDVGFNFGDWYAMDVMTGLLPSLPSGLCNLDFVSARVRLLYGTNYALARKPDMNGQQEVFRDDSGLIVYKNPAALPRVWTVHEAVRVNDLVDARDRLQDSGFDLRKKTFGYGPAPSMEQCDGDTVRDFVQNTNDTSVVVDMKCRGMVIESDNDAPGWIAKVDGVTVPIYPAYTAIRGVVVAAGTHKIEMRYRPMSVIGGGIATLAAFLSALLLWFMPGRAGATPRAPL